MSKPVVKPGPIRPYGDTTGDGMVQLSFTLPIEHSKVAEGAAGWPGKVTSVSRPSPEGSGGRVSADDRPSRRASAAQDR